MNTFLQISDAKGKIHSILESDLIARVGVYGVYQQNGLCLMVKDSKSGKWEFPGGGIDPGESELDALRREILEETGLSLLDTAIDERKLIASVDELFYDIDSSQAWRTVRKYYRITQVAGKIMERGNNCDVVGVGFYDVNQSKIPISSTVKTVIKKMAGL